MKSKIFSLLKQDWFEAGFEAAYGAIAGYLAPFIVCLSNMSTNCLELINWKSFVCAICLAIIAFGRKAFSLYFKNSIGQTFIKEPIINANTSINTEAQK